MAGRRNVYVWMLIAAALLGRSAGGYLVATGWAACTVLVHGVRALYWTVRTGGAADGRPQVPGTESVTGALVSDK